MIGNRCSRKIAVIDAGGIFSSFASGGATDQTDGQLNLLIMANAGNAIPAVMFSEAGDFTLSGAGTALTKAKVTATFFIDIYAVDGAPLALPVSALAMMTFAPAGNLVSTRIQNHTFGRARLIST